MKMNIFSIIALTLSLLVGFNSAQYLFAETLINGLPEGIHGSSVIYDGDDYIYIFGGEVNETFSQYDKVLRFSISRENIEVIAQLPAKGSFGSIQSDTEGNIFYFGVNGGENGQVRGNSVAKFIPGDNGPLIVGSYPEYNLMWGSSVAVGENAYLMGYLGSTDILCFNMRTYEMEKVGSYPTTGTQYGENRASVLVGDDVYIFNDGSSQGPEHVVKVNLKTLESQVLETNLPGMKSEIPSAVYDGKKYIYIVGGYMSLGIGADTDGILRFNPESLEHEFFQVDNFLLGGDPYYYETAPAVVFVEKLNRLYLFGGKITMKNGDTSIRDDIVYIDLGALDDNNVPDPETDEPEPIVKTTTIRYPHHDTTSDENEDKGLTLMWVLGIVLMNLISYILGWSMAYVYYRKTSRLPSTEHFIPQHIAYLPEPIITEKPQRQGINGHSTAA